MSDDDGGEQMAVAGYEVVARARSVLEGVTPGPWRWNFPTGSEQGEDELVSDTDRTQLPSGNGDYPTVVLSGVWHNDDTAGVYVEDADGRFVAEARQLVPELVAEVERLRMDVWFAEHPFLDRQWWLSMDHTNCARYGTDVLDGPTAAPDYQQCRSMHCPKCNRATGSQGHRDCDRAPLPPFDRAADHA